MSEMMKKKSKSSSKPVEPKKQEITSAEAPSATNLEKNITDFPKNFTPFPQSTISETQLKSNQIPLKNTDNELPLTDLSQFKPFPHEQQKETSKPFASNVQDVDSSEIPIEDLSQIESENRTEFPQTPETTLTIEQLTLAKQDPLIKYQADYENLSQVEKEVLEIAKEIMKLKRFDAEVKTERIETLSPLIEELLSKCVAKMTYTKGISKDAIFAAIKTLEDGKWIVTAQRRTKTEVLESPVLKGIIKFIQEHPGTHARDPDIEKELNITRNPFIKHVMVLESFDLIRTKKIGRTQNYFLATVPEIFDDFVVLFANPMVPQIVQLLLDNPNFTLSELAREIGVYHGAIQYHLKTLMGMGILIKNENNYIVNRELLKRYNNLHKIPPFKM
jgi:predicted transcriptional regulator